MRWSESVAMLALAGLLAGACVGEDVAGINVQDIKAELVFGIEKEEPAAPTPFTPPTVPPLRPPPNIEFGNDIVTTPLPPIRPPEPEADPCPDPRAAATPELIAGVNVDELPQEGRYRWRGSVTGIANDDGSTRNVDLGFMSRIVRRVEEVDDTTYTFETIQPNYVGTDADALEGTFLLTRYRVRTESESVTPPNEAGPVLGALDEQDVATPRLGEPDGGVAIVSSTVIDGSGNPVSGVSSFQPTQPLMIVPLPISSGQTFRSTAVDPRSGQTVAISGQMLDRRRINACGDPIDGWLVRLQQTTSGPSGSLTIDSDLVIAPQYGAIAIDEFTQFGDGSAITFTLSGLEVGELPEELA